MAPSRRRLPVVGRKPPGVSPVGCGVRLCSPTGWGGGKAWAAQTLGLGGPSTPSATSADQPLLPAATTGEGSAHLGGREGTTMGAVEFDGKPVGPAHGGGATALRTVLPGDLFAHDVPPMRWISDSETWLRAAEEQLRASSRSGASRDADRLDCTMYGRVAAPVNDPSSMTERECSGCLSSTAGDRVLVADDSCLEDRRPVAGRGWTACHLGRTRRPLRAATARVPWSAEPP